MLHINVICDTHDQSNICDPVGLISYQLYAAVLIFLHRDGGMCCYSTDSSNLVWSVRRGHNSDIQAVDFHHNIAVSGSRDATIKVGKVLEFTLEYARIDVLI